MPLLPTNVFGWGLAAVLINLTNSCARKATGGVLEAECDAVPAVAHHVDPTGPSVFRPG